MSDYEARWVRWLWEAKHSDRPTIPGDRYPIAGLPLSAEAQFEWLRRHGWDRLRGLFVKYDREDLLPVMDALEVELALELEAPRVIVGADFGANGDLTSYVTMTHDGATWTVTGVARTVMK